MNKELIMNEWKKITNYVKANYSNIFDKDIKVVFEKKLLSKKLFCITPEGNCYIEYVSRGNRYTCYSYYFHPERDIKCLDYEERKLQAAEKVISCWEEIKKSISNKESEEYGIAKSKGSSHEHITLDDWVMQLEEKQAELSLPRARARCDMQKAFEKIIERLKNYAGINDDDESVITISFDSLEKIVSQVAEKYGEEVCEWFKYDYRTIAPKNHSTENPYWRMPENLDKLKYCPYCGKKIKVVE